jgi:hypothetical protein
MYDELNRTEIQELIREVDGENAYREAPRKELTDALDESGEIPTCPLEPHRQEMEQHIRKNYRRLRTQLPGCDGKCTTYGCPNIVVVRCWTGFKDDIL